MLGSLFSPLSSRTPFPPWFLPSFLATGIVSCLPPPKYKLLRLAIGIPVFAKLLITAPRFTTGEVALDFVTGIFMSGAVLKWLDVAILHDADISFWRVADLRKIWAPGKHVEQNGIASMTASNSYTDKVLVHGHIEESALDDTTKEVEINLYVDGKPSGQVTGYTNGHIPTHMNDSTNTVPSKGATNGYVSNGHVTNSHASNGRMKLPIVSHPAAQPTDPTEPISPRADGTWWERFRWSISLWSTTRGIGWNWKVKNVPESVSPGYPRLKFLRHTLHRFLFAYLANDFVHACTNWYARSKNGVLPNVYDEPLAVRTAVAWFAAFETYNALQFPYYLFATVTTALYICGPEQWPNLMGDFKDNMWSVRQLWGKCWHSELRRQITEPAMVVTDALGLQKGTNVRKYTELYISFFISGLLHHAGAWMVGRSTGGMYYLWLGQATIIMLEDFMIHLGKKAGIEDSAYLRALGKLWVVVWMSLPTNCVTGAAVVVNQGMGFDPAPFNFSTSALFPIASRADDLFKVILDRGVVFWMLSKALSLIEAQSPSEIFEAGIGAAGAGLLKYIRSC